MFIDDRYEILEKIGSGGMSDVYKAKCHKLNRFVAIKFLKPQYCSDKSFVANFKTEAQSAAALLHPNVVSVYDVNEFEGLYYIVMEYVDGITLKEYIEKNGRLPVKEATSISIQIAQGIEAAHNANIIHRDIKPQNILISREGKIKVTDFGIARTTTANTIGTDILGSVHYISPEQARGGIVDERSDIYSFGIMFYEMITGQLPFEGETTVSIALKHIQENVPPVSDIVPQTPSSVVKIIEKCTQKKPERRYQKVSSLLSDLKTSLISPNEDFVVLEPESSDNATILMSGNEARYIHDHSERYGHEDAQGRAGARRGYENPEETNHRNAPKKKTDKRLKIAGIIAGAVIVVILAIVCITTFGKSGCGGKKDIITYEVPNVVGENLDDAKEKLKKQGFSNITVEYETSNDVDKDNVIKQSVAAGEKKESTTPITLTVSSGKTESTLSDYKGMSLLSARSNLTKLGLEVKVVSEYSDSVESGIVIRMSPASGTKVKHGDTVTLYVSKGKESKTTEVPSLKGLTEAEAIAKLEAANLVYSITYEEDNSNIGKVISQDVRGGMKVDEWTSIGIVVGKEAPTTTAAPETTTAPPTTTTAPETTTEEPTETETTP